MTPPRGSVLILVQNLPVPFDRRVWQESKALTQAGYDVHVICPATKDYSARREVLDGVSIYRYPAGAEAHRASGYLREYGVALLWMLWLGLRIRVRTRIDVVHACNPPDLLFLPALPLIATGAALIYDHHDACPELMVAKGQPENGLQVRLTRLVERLTYRVAHVSIETNDSYRDIALSRGRMNPEDVFVVRSAPEVTRFANAAPDDEWRRGRKRVVAYVGVMGIQDGLDYLIDAAAWIVRAQARDDVQFICVGGGPEFDRLRARVRELGLQDFIEFTGRLSDDDLGTVLATADVCVNPDEVNRMNDISTMNKTMEYMALSKPMVQFELREGRVSAGEASLYARPNDAVSLAELVLQLVDDRERADSMGRLGHERLRRHLSWEVQVPRLLEAYQRALTRRGARRRVRSY